MPSIDRHRSCASASVALVAAVAVAAAPLSARPATGKSKSKIGAVLWVSRYTVAVGPKTLHPGGNPDYHSKASVWPLFPKDQVRATQHSDVKFAFRVNGVDAFCQISGPRGWVQVAPKKGVLLALKDGKALCGTSSTPGVKRISVRGLTITAKDPVLEMVVGTKQTVIKVRSGAVVVGVSGQDAHAVVVGAGWQTTVITGEHPLEPKKQALSATEKTALGKLVSTLPALTDHAPPTVDVTGPPGFTQTTAATLAFGGPEAGVTYSCALDSVELHLCTSPARYPKLAAGKHTFVVRAIDQAGNTGPVNFYSWTIDNRPPVVTITSQQPSLTAATTATFAFAADESGVAFTCRLDGGAFAPCSSPTAYSGLSADTHSFAVVATDAAGNVSQPKTSTWTIDLRAPVVAITSRPAAVVASDAATFTFTADKSPVSFTCQLDGGAAAPCGSPQSYMRLSQGKHTFLVSARDVVGNTGQTSYSWLVDTVPPTTTITGGPGRLTYNSSATFTFAANEKPVTFGCQLDNAAPTPCSSPKTYTAGAGSHRFVVSATDTAGNVERPGATYSWTVNVIG
jgi:hypothetical protein